MAISKMRNGYEAVYKQDVEEMASFYSRDKYQRWPSEAIKELKEKDDVIYRQYGCFGIRVFNERGYGDFFQILVEDDGVLCGTGYYSTAHLKNLRDVIDETISFIDEKRGG